MQSYEEKTRGMMLVPWRAWYRTLNNLFISALRSLSIAMTNHPVVNQYNYKLYLKSLHRLSVVGEHSCKGRQPDG